MKKNNILVIALYMGAKVCQDYGTSQLLDFGEKTKSDVLYPDGWSRFHSVSCLKYNKEWNWIIPVYQKLMQDENINDKNKNSIKILISDPTSTPEELCNMIISILS